MCTFFKKEYKLALYCYGLLHKMAKTKNYAARPCSASMAVVLAMWRTFFPRSVGLKILHLPSTTPKEETYKGSCCDSYPSLHSPRRNERSQGSFIPCTISYSIREQDSGRSCTPDSMLQICVVYLQGSKTNVKVARFVPVAVFLLLFFALVFLFFLIIFI